MAVGSRHGYRSDHHHLAARNFRPELAPLLLRELFAQPAVLFDGLARSEVVQLEQLTDLDFGVPPAKVHRGSSCPLDGLVLRLGLDQPVTGHKLLRFREWS